MTVAPEQTRTPQRPGLSTAWRVLIGALVVLFLVGAAVANHVVTREPEEQRAVAVRGNRGSDLTREVPPDQRGAPVRLTGTGLDGEPIDSTGWAGRVVVVNVWGSWCAPCRKEAPAFVAAHRDFGPAGVQFLGLNVRDDPASARAFAKRVGITYPSIDDDDGTAVLAFRGTVPASAVPSTVVLDRQGRVAARVIGEIDAVTLRILVQRSLTEKA